MWRLGRLYDRGSRTTRFEDNPNLLKFIRSKRSPSSAAHDRNTVSGGICLPLIDNELLSPKN